MAHYLTHIYLDGVRASAHLVLGDSGQAQGLGYCGEQIVSTLILVVTLDPTLGVEVTLSGALGGKGAHSLRHLSLAHPLAVGLGLGCHWYCLSMLGLGGMPHLVDNYLSRYLARSLPRSLTP